MGVESALNPKDHLITAYRCHGQQYLRGDSLENIFAELLGKRMGSSKGKGGSMHLYRPENNFYVGAQIPLGGGIALACKYKKTKEAVVAMMGDGAANQGQVYETANMAALWKLPLVFLIENNQYGMGTSIERAAFCTDYYTRGHYIPGIQCDGMDIISVLATMEHALEHCREGKGPIFVEMKTYRYHGHSMSDPGKSYREKDEVLNFRKNKDPIQLCKNYIIENKWATSEDLKMKEKDINQSVEAAIKTAMENEEPPLKEAFSDIYYNENLPNIRGPEREISN